MVQPRILQGGKPKSTVTQTPPASRHESPIEKVIEEAVEEVKEIIEEVVEDVEHILRHQQTYAQPLTLSVVLE